MESANFAGEAAATEGLSIQEHSRLAFASAQYTKKELKRQREEYGHWNVKEKEDYMIDMNGIWKFNYKPDTTVALVSVGAQPSKIPTTDFDIARFTKAHLNYVKIISSDF